MHVQEAKREDDCDLYLSSCSHLQPPNHWHRKEDDYQVHGHITTTESNERFEGVFANAWLDRVPGFRERAASQEITDDYRETESQHESEDCICNSEKCFVGAENCDVEIHDGNLDRRVGCGPHDI